LTGGHPGRTGDIWINPGRDGAKRLPTRYADYPLREGDVFRLDSPGGGGFSDALKRDPLKVLDDVREGVVSPEAAEREYGVILKRNGAGWMIDDAETATRRAAASPPSERQP
jgi:N-methylhydantoinase B/oxoprolinase/acetone carboxylase alpha subunit